MSEENAAVRNDPPESAYTRFHPLTPIVTGWKVIVGLIAIVGFQNFDLIEDLVTNGVVNTENLGLIALGIAGIVVVAVLFAILPWWTTKYAVTDEGVFVRRKFLSTSRRIAPRQRIDSVSVERPFVARLVGLSKVKIELAGAGESHVDLEYLGRVKAEDIHSTVLELARGDAQTAEQMPAGAAPAEYAPLAPESEGPSRVEESTQSIGERAKSIAFDSDSDGELLARIPTSRVLHSLLLDISLMIGMAFTLVMTAVWLIGSFASGEFTFSAASLFAIVPALLAGPRMIFSRLESSWGFTSRATSAGLRARRGLINSRSDNLTAAKIQQAEISQPLLWRSRGWFDVSVSTAGMDELESVTESSGRILPVGTASELDATLTHLMPPTGDLVHHRAMRDGSEAPSAAVLGVSDAALLRGFLSVPQSQLPGTRPFHWTSPISRHTHVYALSRHALIARTGWLKRTLTVIPRDRIQGVEISQGPIALRIGSADITVAYAGGSFHVSDIPVADAAALCASLGADAGTSRRFTERGSWLEPRLLGGTA
ncbi:PH domain-containing protein [Dermabacter sp. p3-SID358]|uniref:PH domain-containing protein n=1 Tax=Dermabacter sp. p3-SID358 TaxID=2916114 RepID=UPI0021A5F659|nr:PH domain-containing protein [Dermabacter sp. p3-SID358]MCT1867375.1 PH domain-containing protein [Dermabacter sp. p3-SID358]